jgi:hypothetical protein
VVVVEGDVTGEVLRSDDVVLLLRDEVVVEEEEECIGLVTTDVKGGGFPTRNTSYQ